MSDEIEINQDNLAAIQHLVIGRTIIGFEREPDPDPPGWTHGDNSVMITLDDGARLLFVGFGYDASSLESSYAAGDQSAS